MLLTTDSSLLFPELPIYVQVNVCALHECSALGCLKMVLDSLGLESDGLVRMLGMEPWSSGRAARVLNC